MRGVRALVAATVAAVSLVAAGVPVAAATAEDTIAAEAFRFVNDEREARGLGRLGTDIPERRWAAQHVYAVGDITSGGAVVQQMSDDYRRSMLLDPEALSMQVSAVCDNGELTLRVSLYFWSGAGPDVPSASPVVTPADAGTRCPAGRTSPEPEPAPGPVGPTPRAIDDSCPDGRVSPAGFGDTSGNPHEPAIDCVVWWGIARGKDARTYDPSGRVSRGQMASFIARLVVESGGTLPEPTRDRFVDDNASPHEDNINRLAAAGIVGGTGDGRYQPSAAVRRDQMATFLIRAYEYRTDAALQPGGDWFTDDDGNPHEPNINKAAQYGLTGGDPAGGYNPSGLVSRAQMASFLVRTLDLLVEMGHTPAR